jgi:hypothetical protein
VPPAADPETGQPARISGHTKTVSSAANLYVAGPLIAFGVVAALIAVLRWAFDSDIAGTEAKLFAAANDDDFGLLGVAGVVESDDEAETVRAVLADAGIRATTSRKADGRVRILVFASELEQARRLAGLH